jgi:hypothetical protein
MKLSRVDAAMLAQASKSGSDPEPDGSPLIPRTVQVLSGHTAQSGGARTGGASVAPGGEWVRAWRIERAWGVRAVSARRRKVDLLGATDQLPPDWRAGNASTHASRGRRCGRPIAKLRRGQKAWSPRCCWALWKASRHAEAPGAQAHASRRSAAPLRRSAGSFPDGCERGDSEKSSSIVGRTHLEHAQKSTRPAPTPTAFMIGSPAFSMNT